MDAVTTGIYQFDVRAEALVGAYERAGYRRAQPAILQPAEPFLDLSGEDIRRRMYPHDRRARARAVPAPRLHDRGVARLSGFVCRPGAVAGFCYLGPVFRQEDEGTGEFLQAGIEFLRAPRHRRGRRRDAGARARDRRALRHRRSGHPDGRRRAVRRAGAGARSCSDLEAPPGEGLQSQGQSRAGPRSAGARRGQRTARISGRAGRARGLRSEGRACARHRSAVDCRHHHRRRPLGRRDRRPLPRTGGARRRHRAAAAMCGA